MKDAELAKVKSSEDASLSNAVITLESQTLELLDALRKESQELADMLEGAWVVLGSSNNPDMLAQAAHSIRELIEKAPYKIPSVPIRATEPKSTVEGESRNDQAGLMMRTLAGKHGQISEQLLTAKLDVYSGIREYAVAVSHHDKKTRSEELRHKIQDLENIFLDLMGSRTAEDFDDIDRLVEQGGDIMITGDLIAKVLAKINTTQAARDHFFKAINSPEWVAPLAKENIFDDAIKEVRKDGYVWFPVWEEGEYLVRIADKAQDEVLEIIRKLPDTDNERVMTNVVEALIKLDTAKATQLTSKVKSYIQKPQYLLLDKAVGDLIVKFASDSAIKEAVELARVALEIMPDPEAEAESKKEFSWLHPRTRYRDYDYEELVNKILPVLLENAPDKAVSVFANLVVSAVRHERPETKTLEEASDVETIEDGSAIWRPVIEEAGKYPSHPRDIVIDSLNSSLLALVGSDKVSIEAKAKQLKGLIDMKLSVIKRSVEYALRDNHSAKELSDIYRPLAKEFAQIIKQPAVRFSGEFEPVVSNSGITQEDFEALSDDALIEKLNTYEPPSTFFSDREALGSNVEAAAKSNPNRFIALLPRIADTKYLYLYAVINAFYADIDNLSPEQIGSIAKTLSPILSSEPKESGEPRDYYKWARSSAARFTGKAFDKSENKSHERITRKEADEVLGLALLLCRDDEPTVEREKEEEGNLDPATLSLNTIRGEAMHSIIHAMVWANRNKADDGFKDRVFEELTRSLKDPTQAIRTVYGMHYAPIWGTREEWAEKNRDVIFSDDEFGRAAIDAYTNYSSVHPDTISILGDVYRRQLPRLVAEPSDTDRRDMAREGLKHLVQHLSLHYWYGTIDLSDGSMMKELLDTAHPKYLSEVINFVGFRLYKADEREREVTEEELVRLVDLWQYVLALVKDDDSKKEALEDFGTWFASGKFEDGWSLDQLLEALKIAGSVDLDFAILERLEKMAASHPAEAVGIIDAMVDGATRDRWAIGSWRDNAVSILKTAYQSDDAAIKKAVIDLVNKLLRKGYEEYRGVVK